MSKKICVVDLDYTILRNYNIGYFASLYLLEWAIEAGIVDRKYSKSINDAYCLFVNNYSTIDEFINEIIIIYTEAIVGVRKTDLERMAINLALQMKTRVSPFVWDLFQKMKMNYTTILLSGSAHEIVSELAEIWGFDFCKGTELFVNENGLYTGKADNTAQNKIVWLESFIKNQGLTWDDSIVIGDASVDYELLMKATYSIPFNPTARLFNQISTKRTDLIIVSEDPTGYVFYSGRMKFAELLQNNMCTGKATKK